MFRRSSRAPANTPATDNISAPPGATDPASTVTWWDPTHDPALAKILASAQTHATRDLPDVTSEPDKLIAEFDELLALVDQRLRSLQAQAQDQVRSDVELVASASDASAPADTADSFDPVPHNTIEDATSAARAARARARVAAARERIRSASEALQIAVAAHVAYGQEAVARLDATVRTYHRHPTWLTYTVPTVTAPPGVYEIGLARLDLHAGHDEAPSETPDTENSDPPHATLPHTG